VRSINIKFLLLSTALLWIPSMSFGRNQTSEESDEHLLPHVLALLERVKILKHDEELSHESNDCLSKHDNRSELSLSQISKIVQEPPEELTIDDLNLLRSILEEHHDYLEGSNVVTRGCCKKIKKSLNVRGTAHFCKNVEVEGDLAVEGVLEASAIETTGSITIGSCTGLTGSLTIGGNLQVCDNTTVNGILSAGTGIFSNNITVGNCTGLIGNVTAGGDLQGCGNATVDGIFTAGTGIFSDNLSVEGTVNVCLHDLFGYNK
jgi:hypothetical protein